MYLVFRMRPSLYLPLELLIHVYFLCTLQNPVCRPEEQKKNMTDSETDNRLGSNFQFCHMLIKHKM